VVRTPGRGFGLGRRWRHGDAPTPVRSFRRLSRRPTDWCVLEIRSRFLIFPRGAVYCSFCPASAAASGEPLSIINGEKSTHKTTHRYTRCYSISIIPISITATAAPAASFLPPNRKCLGLNSEAHSKLVAEAFPMLANGHSPGTFRLGLPWAFAERIGGDNRPKFLTCEIAKRFDVAKA
jgi:hypothetical protein